jgi:hypothetical protein
MTNEARYFEVLSGAIAQIQEDSFEARGSVYDRLWNIVVDRLRAEGNDSDEALASERAAFLAAVKRIEFGERAQALTPDEGEQGRLPDMRPRRPLLRPIALRMATGCAVLLVICISYLIIVVSLDPASAERWAGDDAANSWQSQMVRAALSIGNLIERRATVAPAVSQRAVLYEESETTATGSTFSGNAVWRHQKMESTFVGLAPAAVSIDIEIPQKSFLLRMLLKRAPDTGGVISHFVEFRFLNVDGSASDAVEEVVGILMKTDELSRGIELAGKVVKVQRGMFLMGLSAAEADLARNLTLLQERRWLDVPLIMKDKSRSILAIEKGSSGRTAIKQTLTAWGQT